MNSIKETLKEKIIVTTKLGKTNVERQRKKGSKSLSVPVAIGKDSDTMKTPPVYHLSSSTSSSFFSYSDVDPSSFSSINTSTDDNSKNEPPKKR
ncbi:zinc finger CCHC domain-containing protein 10-like [Oryx dammah]|uniref:zinc finger CCHC domain-containing protein 10-like n=1 Tax=Oryx dammah TaxID=59534 RepID=UPI001A9B22DD|nr:zinc finger CCHC domain-containing protein 10-like [Oryx dammah]